MLGLSGLVGVTASLLFGVNRAVPGPTDQGPVPVNPSSPFEARMLAQMNQRRRQLGLTALGPLPTALRPSFEGYARQLDHRMLAVKACLHGGEWGAPSPFVAVSLPVGWRVRGEVVACHREDFKAEILEGYFWNSVVHRRILYERPRLTHLACLTSGPRTGDPGSQRVICLTFQGA
jgi:hypothetical protein